MTSLRSHVLLVGFMGSGKTSVGRLLAERLGAPFVDLDERVERSAGAPVAQIFAGEGEDGFRDREAAALAALEAEPPAVVACGGGVVLRESNRALLRTLGVVVYLGVSAEQAMQRCGLGRERPLLAGRTPEQIEALLAGREVLYAEVATVSFNTDGLSPDDVELQVERALRERGDLEDVADNRHRRSSE